MSVVSVDRSVPPRWSAALSLLTGKGEVVLDERRRTDGDGGGGITSSSWKKEREYKTTTPAAISILSWKEFSRGVKGTYDADRDAKDALNRLSCLAVSIIPPECCGLGTSCDRTLLEALVSSLERGGKGYVKDARVEIEIMRGGRKVPDEEWAEAKKLAKKLHNWQQEYLRERHAITRKKPETPHNIASGHQGRLEMDESGMKIHSKPPLPPEMGMVNNDSWPWFLEDRIGEFVSEKDSMEKSERVFHSPRNADHHPLLYEEQQFHLEEKKGSGGNEGEEWSNSNCAVVTATGGGGGGGGGGDGNLQQPSNLDDDVLWLYSCCTKYVEKHYIQLSAADLASSIVATTIASGSNNGISVVAMQEDLFNLLGEMGLDFIMQILEKRQALVQMASNGVDFNVYSELLSNDTQQSLPPFHHNNYPTTSLSDIRSQKEHRKDNKRLAKSTAIERQRVEELSKGQAQIPSWLKKGAPPTLSMSPPLDDMSALASEGTREYRVPTRGLPPGATKYYEPGKYEMVHIPIPERRPQVKDGDLVSIGVLEPEWARLAFKGIKQLNPIQSRMYECAYRTSENMLVCAPTGAGKTNIAMLALLQQFQQFANASATINIDEEVIKHEHQGWCKGFKAVYVAPMKALAQEVVSKFKDRLDPLGLVVKENTGDMQLSRAEIEEANLLVVTPEKWDVVTRKGGDGTLVELVSLLIIDEVHLLAENRGAVIESIVARMHRHVETAQRPVRVVGLSATLPNFKDVGTFLRVQPSRGLFHFGPEYRPVPLEQTFIGIIEKQRTRQQLMLVRIAYERALESVREGNQVMVFVHARKDTVCTAQGILALAAADGTCEEFSPPATLEAHKKHAPALDKCSNGELRVLYSKGFGCHHAGMPRRERQLTECAFADGAINVLVCTATLAWGVNLPVHTVIIKGTEVYNPEKGGVVDLSILDVLQIFGRAGRPQFDTSGEAVLITSHKSMDKYLSLLTRNAPIESTFVKSLPDHLNAEVSAGAVTNIEEASNWLAYTYLYVRMRKNPLVYGIGLEEAEFDPQANAKRRELIQMASTTLDKNRMIRFDLRSGNMASTDLGRIASLFYISHESVHRFSTNMKPHMTPAKALDMMCLATEFEQIKVRPEEIKELDKLKTHVCPMPISAPVTDSHGKVNVLLQAYISSKLQPKFYTLLSDMLYISQNAARIARALFETTLKKGWCSLAYTMLRIATSIDRRMWWFQSPLRQFTGELPPHVLRILDEFEGGEKTRGILGANALLDMEKSEIGELVHCTRVGGKVLALARFLPNLSITATFQPITRSILKATISIKSNFKWADKWHKGVEPWWIWVEDDESERIYHSEKLLLHPKDYYQEHVLSFCIPVFDPLPAQYWIRAVSDKWVGCSHVEPVPFDGLVLPPHMDAATTYTELLDLRPLPVQALHDSKAAKFVFPRISHFNPIQTQLFHVLYHSDNPVLVGAPTGSGKTAIAEIAVLRLLRMLNRHAVAVYIAPLKALAKERLKDWVAKFNPLGIQVTELTGDVSPDDTTLRRANIIITTPEKWDLVTRGTKHYVKRTGLIIIDEVHLLGEDRGPVLEAVVSRARRFNEECCSNSSRSTIIRLVALSTALANPWDLGDWLGIRRCPGGGVYNFRPSVRPIPCEVHIQGFPEKHYCPRMTGMNKTVYASIMEHSPDKPALIFVASRRQTRLTAMSLIVFAAASDNPKRFFKMAEVDAEELRREVKDPSLCNALSFGIGMHHAGLALSDRDIVERLFTRGCLQVVVATSTLAWGVNFPAHLVVIKGAEYYDGKKKRYVDFPVTDILQMAGRAGRPQFDTHAVAVLLVRADQKNFLKRFLYEPFPVESHLFADNARLVNLLNAEISSGAVSSRYEAAQFLTWTFLFRRLLSNPSFYNLEDTSQSSVESYLLGLVDEGLQNLERSGCVQLDSSSSSSQKSEDESRVYATPLGKIASRCYIDYRTMDMGRRAILSTPTTSLTPEEACFLVTNAIEFAELPVRHNEENICLELASHLRWHDSLDSFDSPHTKAFLLLQAYFEGCPLPISDFYMDTRTVFDQVGRVLGALVDAASELAHLGCALGFMKLNQMLSQAKWDDSNPLTQIPGIGPEQADELCFTLLQIVKDGTAARSSRIAEVLGCITSSPDGEQQHYSAAAAAAHQFLFSLPDVRVTILPSPSVQSVNIRIWKERGSSCGRDQNDCKLLLPSVSYMKKGEGRGLGWWIFVGCKVNNELLALKRIKSIYR